MPSEVTHERLRFSTYSVVRAIVVIFLILVVADNVGGARRILMWIAAAATLAGLLYPAFAKLATKLPRIVSILLVMIALWGTVGYATYAVLDSLNQQTTKLKQDAPARLAEIEDQDTALGRTLDDAKASERANAFFGQLDDRLRGGPPAKAIAGAASRGVALLVINVLTIFFILHSEELLRGLLQLDREPKHRSVTRQRLITTSKRTFDYLRGTVAMAFVAGAIAYFVARLAHVPAPLPLAVFAGVWDIIPILGIAVGGLPIALLAAASSTTTAILIALFFLAYQIFEGRYLQREVENKSVKPGPFLSFVVAFGGLEAFGVGGMFLGLVVMTAVVTWFDEVFPDAAN